MYQSASISNKILHAPWTLVKKVMNFAYRDRTQWCTKTWFWIVTSNLRPRTQLQVYDFWKNKVNFSLAYRHRDKQISFLIFSQWTTEIFHIDTNTLWMNVFTIKRQEKKKKKKVPGLLTLTLSRWVKPLLRHCNSSSFFCSILHTAKGLYNTHAITLFDTTFFKFKKIIINKYFW